MIFVRITCLIMFILVYPPPWLVNFVLPDKAMIESKSLISN